MSIHVNVGGSNKKTSSAWMKINGEWKKGTFWNNVNGEWKKHSYDSFEFLWQTCADSLADTFTYTDLATLSETGVIQTKVSLGRLGFPGVSTIANPYSNTLLLTYPGTLGDLPSRLKECDKFGTILGTYNSPLMNSVPRMFIDKNTVLFTNNALVNSVDYKTATVKASWEYKPSGTIVDKTLLRCVYNKVLNQIFLAYQVTRLKSDTEDISWAYVVLDLNTLTEVCSYASAIPVNNGFHYTNAIPTETGFIVISPAYSSSIFVVETINTISKTYSKQSMTYPSVSSSQIRSAYGIPYNTTSFLILYTSKHQSADSYNVVEYVRTKYSDLTEDTTQGVSRNTVNFKLSTGDLMYACGMYSTRIINSNTLIDNYGNNSKVKGWVDYPTLSFKGFINTRTLTAATSLRQSDLQPNNGTSEAF